MDGDNSKTKRADTLCHIFGACHTVRRTDFHDNYYLFLNDTLLENHCTYGSAVYSSNVGNIVRKTTVNSELENSRCAHFKSEKSLGCPKECRYTVFVPIKQS
jgi:hypothetical protein